MDYTLQYFAIDEIKRIKDIWLYLQTGSDMTYFQTYSWNRMLVDFTPVIPQADCGYFVIFNSKGNPSMIAPLWVLRHRVRVFNSKGIHFIGRNSFSDYLNLIYREFDPAAFRYLCSYLRKRYGKIKWYIHELKDDTEFSRHLSSLGNAAKEKTTECVALTLPHGKEEYLSSLSKSTRQNLRTASNRAQKEGVDFEIVMDYSSFDKASDLALLDAMRNHWSSRRAALNPVKLPLFKKILFVAKNIIVNKHIIKVPQFVPYHTDRNSLVMLIKNKANDEIAAFFNYGIDDSHRQVVVMAAAVNEDYVRFSPGMLLMKSFIDNAIDSGKYQTIDFTRGTETYKLKLGGLSHTTSDFLLKI